MNQEMLQIQALKFYNKVIGDGSFGSRGYIEKIIKRHGIRLLKITREELSSNIARIDNYTRMFSEDMASRNLHPSQIFNADESVLYYKVTFPFNNIC